MASVEVACAAEEDSSSGSSEGIDDVALSLEGMTMLLNNEWQQAEELFTKYRDESPLMCAGYSMFIFMQALMSFEEEKLAEAMKALQDTEKRCETSTGFMKSVKHKIGKRKKNAIRLEENLERQIIVADCILYQAMLTFIQQDLAGYVKGGWLLRKAWKHYNKLHKEISTLHSTVSTRGSLQSLPESDQQNPDSVKPSSSSVSLSSQKNSLKRSGSSSDSVDSLAGTAEMTKEVSGRLLGAVSFGFGAFQLCLSLVPPKVLKIIEFLGFEGDRSVGLEALDVASCSRDMKAPLATLGLVWYHSVIRPFFALDGTNLTAGIDEAKQILERGQQEYPKSALFLFFKARLCRLNSEIDEAYSTYCTALEACAHQREIQLICDHEIGWIHMMKLNWVEAYQCFIKLKEESRWSKSFYAYLSSCCIGATGDVAKAHAIMKEVPGLVRRKNNQIEAFVLKRSERFVKKPPSQEHLTLLLLEVLYLWNAIPTCRKDDLDKMLEECNKQNDKKVFHLRSLIEGAIYNETDMEEMALQCFEEAVARHQGMKEDYHVPAFASYEMGMILAKQPQTFEKAKKFLIQAKDQYKDFDFDGRLHVRVTAALKRIKTEGTPI